MQPQGTALFNDEYFTAITDQINSINVCSDLQDAVDVIFADLKAAKHAINLEITLLTPLITVPTDLSSVISWITATINTYYLPYLRYADQLAGLITKISELTTAVENAAARIESCSITIPST